MHTRRRDVTLHTILFLLAMTSCFFIPSLASFADEGTGLSLEAERLERGLSIADDARRSTNVVDGLSFTDIVALNEQSDVSVGQYSNISSRSIDVSNPDCVLENGLGKLVSWGSGTGSALMRFDLPEGAFVQIDTFEYNTNLFMVGLYDSSGELLHAWAGSDDASYGIFALPAGSYYVQLIADADGFANMAARYYAETIELSDGSTAIFEKEDNSPEEDQPVSSASTKVNVNGWFAGSYYTLPALVDLDYFTFDVTREARIKLDFITTKRLMIALVDEEGQVLTGAEDGASLVAESSSDGGVVTLDLGLLGPGSYNIVVTSRDESAIGGIYYCYINEYATVFPDVTFPLRTSTTSCGSHPRASRRATPTARSGP